jgi:hypothetical protein
MSDREQSGEWEVIDLKNRTTLCSLFLNKQINEKIILGK